MADAKALFYSTVAAAAAETRTAHEMYDMCYNAMIARAGGVRDPHQDVKLQALLQYVLRRAAKHGHLDLLQRVYNLLADRGVSTIESRKRAVILACQNGHLATVRYLHTLPVDTGRFAYCKHKVVCAAAAGGHVPILEYLCVECDICCVQCMDAALVEAAVRGHQCVVRYLCEAGASPCAHNNSALIYACAAGHVAVVRFLCELPLSRGVQPNVANNKPLLLAVKCGHLSIVRYLCELPLERGVDPSALIVTAARCGNSHIVEYLCEGESAANQHAALMSCVDVTFFKSPANFQKCKAVVWTLLDMPSVARMTSSWRLVRHLVHKLLVPEKQHLAPWPRQVWAYLDVLRFLLHELPGGDLWLEDHGDGDDKMDATWVMTKLDDDQSVAESTLQVLPWGDSRDGIADGNSLFAFSQPPTTYELLRVWVWRWSVWRRRRQLLLLRLLRDQTRARTHAKLLAAS